MAKQDIHRQYEGLLERFGNGDIDRRTFLSGIGVMALAAGVVTTTSTAFSRYANAAQSIHFDGYGGASNAAFTKHVFEPFTAATGIQVAMGSYPGPDAILTAAIADGPGVHDFFWSSSLVAPYRIRRQGLGVEIDEAKVPRIKDLVQKFVDVHRTVVGDGKLTSIPFSLSGSTLAYNREKIDKAEVLAKGFRILLDPKYKAGLVGDRNFTSRVWIAALQTGQDPNDIKDLPAVWDAMRQSRQAVLKYLASGVDQINIWSSGDAFLGDCWYVPFYTLRRNGYPIEGYRDPQGLYVAPGGIVAFKGSPMDAYYAMMDIMLRPEVMLNWAIAAGNLPLLDPTKHPFPPEVQAIPGYDPSGTGEGFMWYDPKYWGDNADLFARETQRIMAGA